MSMNRVTTRGSCMDRNRGLWISVALRSIMSDRKPDKAT